MLMAGLFLGAVALASVAVLVATLLQGEEPKDPPPALEDVYSRVALALARPGAIAHVTATIDSDSGYQPVRAFEAWIDAARDRARVIENSGDRQRPHRSDTLIENGTRYGAANGTEHESAVEGCRESKSRVIVIFQTCLLDRVDPDVNVSVGRSYGDKDAIVLRTRAKYSGIDSALTVSDDLFIDAVSYLPLARKTNHYDSFGGGSRSKSTWSFTYEFIPRELVPSQVFARETLRPSSSDFVLDQPDVIAPLYWLGPEYTWRNGIVPIELMNVRLSDAPIGGTRAVRLDYVRTDDESSAPFVVLIGRPLASAPSPPFEVTAPWMGSPCVEERPISVGLGSATIYSWSDTCSGVPSRFAAELLGATTITRIDVPGAPAWNPYASVDALESLLRSLGPR
jgi:hypothetical protein